MDKWQQFFIFCSGIAPSLLEKTPTDKNKYIGIGATVLFTGILAFLSSGYALYKVFDSWLTAIFFGLIWGLMIFNLDRYIVSSMKRQGSFFRDLLTAIPRFAMAVILAMVISVPLELKIFDKEITSELILMEQEKYLAQEEALMARFSEQKQSLLDERDAINDLIAKKTVQRDQLQAEATAEADGTGGSMQRNLGPIYRVKKENADKAQLELDQLQASLSGKDEQIANDLLALETTIAEEIERMNRQAIDGMAFRLEALNRLSNSSNTIWMATLFITLLFIAIETAPLFVKLIAPRSPYDYILNQLEHEFKMEHATVIGFAESKTKNALAYETQTHSHRTESRVRAEKELIDIAIAQRLDELKKQPIAWRQVFNSKNILDHSGEA